MEKEQPLDSKEIQRRLIIAIMKLLLGFLLLYYAHVLTQPFSPFRPASDSIKPYEKHYHFSFRFPFVTHYYLMLPKDYDSKYSYPTILMLHGVSRHMDGGKDLMSARLRSKYPFIVIIPIAPLLFRWANTDILPDALPTAIDVLDSVQKIYNVNPNKIYISGYSMGGEGTFEAIANYHNIFAAAVPLDAAWDPNDISRFDKIPIWMHYGKMEPFAPIAKSLAKELAYQDFDIKVSPYPMGHGTWTIAYKNEKLWDWLYKQSKKNDARP